MTTSSKNPIDETMGNPQERSFAWLAGIIDGEGSITFQTYIKKSNGNLRITPFISIRNNDDGIIAECQRILNEIGVKHRWYAADDKGYIGRVAGEEAVLKLIDAIYPYLFSIKKHRSDVIRKYIDSRHSMRFARNELGQITRQPYTRNQIELVSSIRQHHAAKSSETLRQAANVVS